MNRTINPVVYHPGEDKGEGCLLDLDQLKVMEYYESTFNMPSYMHMAFDRTLYAGYNAERVMPVVFLEYAKPYFGMEGALKLLGFGDDFKMLADQYYNELRAVLCVCADHSLPELIKLNIMLDEEGLERMKGLLGLGETPDFDYVVKTATEWGEARYV